MPTYAALDARVAAVAAGQHGAFSRSQAAAAGLSAAQIDRRVRSGVWTRVLPRVYRHSATPESDLLLWSAAVLWAGRGCALSHTTAAALWRIAGEPFDATELVVPKVRAPEARGVIVHRVGTLDAGDVRPVHGLPATSPVRTVIDLAGVLDDDGLRRSIERAVARGLVRLSGIVARLDALGSAGRPGAARLRRVVRD